MAVVMPVQAATRFSARRESCSSLVEQLQRPRPRLNSAPSPYATKVTRTARLYLRPSERAGRCVVAQKRPAGWRRPYPQVSISTYTLDAAHMDGTSTQLWHKARRIVDGRSMATVDVPECGCLAISFTNWAVSAVMSV